MSVVRTIETRVRRAQRPSTKSTESAWDPRVLLTLETRMEHGKHWSAAEAAEVLRRAA